MQKINIGFNKIKNMNTLNIINMEETLIRIIIH